MTSPCSEIAILLYPGAQMSAALGISDLLEVANRLARSRDPALPCMRISHWRLTADSAALERVYDTDPSAGLTPAIVICPPGLGEPITATQASILTPWLLEHHRAGATLASVCAGAFLLAETGLLSGRPATTHWTYAEAFAARFPQIKVDAEKLLIDDGDLLTAGGLMAWTDLGLRLVDRVLGPTLMLETAQFLLIDPPGREQRFYSGFSPRLRHGDTSILRVQHWLQSQAAQRIAVATMAEQAGLEERTFLRRFKAATGLTPIEYYQHLRASRAREMLELTNGPVDEIAWKVGYADPGAFRRVFLKITGLTPGDYRRRFSARPSSRPLE